MKKARAGYDAANYLYRSDMLSLFASRLRCFRTSRAHCNPD